MATAIRNGSAAAPSVPATPTPMGAIKITAAALLIRADWSMEVTKTTPSMAQGGTVPPRTAIVAAMRAAPPVVSKASPAGIRAPKELCPGIGCARVETSGTDHT